MQFLIKKSSLDKITSWLHAKWSCQDYITATHRWAQCHAGGHAGTPLWVSQTVASFPCKSSGFSSGFVCVTQNLPTVSNLSASPTHSCRQTIGMFVLIMTGLLDASWMGVTWVWAFLNIVALVVKKFDGIGTPASFCDMIFSSARSTGQFISTAQSRQDGRPCFGFVLMSIHISVMGRCSTTTSPCSIVSMMKKNFASKCLVRLLLDILPCSPGVLSFCYLDRFMHLWCLFLVLALSISSRAPLIWSHRL